MALRQDGFRRVCLLVLVSLLVSLVPPMAPGTTPVMAAPAMRPAAAPADPAIPPPPDARSSSLPADDVVTLRQQYGQQHTLGAALFDGDFPTPSYPVHVAEGPWTLDIPAIDQDDIVTQVITLAPGQYHQRLEASVTLVPDRNLSAAVAARPAGTDTWIDLTTLASSSVVTTTTGMVSLSAALVPAATPLDVLLRCKRSWRDDHGTCTFNHLRFVADVPGWQPTDPSESNTTSRFLWAVGSEAPLIPADPDRGSFLSIDVSGAGSGAKFRDVHIYRSPCAVARLFQYRYRNYESLVGAYRQR